MTMPEGSQPERLSLAVVRPIAVAIFNEMLPFCERIRVAGSVRRGRQDVKDVDIVAIPKMSTRLKEGSLFPEEVPVNVLYEEWGQTQTRIRWIKAATSEIIDWKIDPDGKYWRGYLDEPGCNVDIFLTTPEQFGLTYFLKTGSWEWNTAVMVHASRVGHRVEGNSLWRGRQQLNTPNERDIFEALGMEYVEPAHRNGRDDIRAIGGTGER